MIGKIKNIVIIVVVVAVVSGLGWAILTKRLNFSVEEQLVLAETSVTLEEIKDIGELFAAEYYGEVVKSLSEMNIAQKTDLLQPYMQIKKFVDAFVSTQTYKDAKFLKRDDLLQEQVLKYYPIQFNLLVKNFGYIKSSEFFSPDSAKFISEILPKKINQDETELLYLGRGWVKMGFNLKNLQSDLKELNNILENAPDTLDTLVLDLEPEVLNADINPWFIAEKNIKGFEVLETKNEDEITFEQMKMVKKGCKRKLVEDAISRDLIAKTISSGEESLTAFFNLFLIKNKKIKNVKIAPKNVYLKEKLTILYDNEIDEDDIRTMQKLLELKDRSDTYYSSLVNIMNLPKYTKSVKWKEFYDFLIMNYPSLKLSGDSDNTATK